MQRLTPRILATQKVEIGRTRIEVRPGKKVERPYLNNLDVVVPAGNTSYTGCVGRWMTV
jgi:hypothetical protein